MLGLITGLVGVRGGGVWYWETSGEEVGVDGRVDVPVAVEVGRSRAAFVM